MFDELGLKPTSLRKLSKGGTLFTVGGNVQSFFSLETGKIRMSRYLNDGNKITFYVVTSGQLFAEASLFSDAYHCEAVAEEASTVSVYSKSEFLEALRGSEAGTFKFMELLAKQIQKQRAHLELMHIKSATGRVLAYIHSKMNSTDTELNIPSTWKTVAEEINLTHEAVYRALALLEHNGAISRDGTKVILGRV
tara:strand:- start:163 stop:744 length:582 start_codon:yes stop_codon:yes gene_type:complete